eukprot:gnl/TRDRNA2_/TRDRNA2_61510_c0_seq1.p1 gnl/TRDRNA2_/TRDRNA2_61510_c0~~gnl/TRDRNA2_/TRDRNA2_61510_c0_seq1.p1  ORF type:complete len:113 (-),score=18.46 gnl/TRDRNA2_/TRDRNA2_61510_c0_seq1:44-361(-)
MAPAKSRSDTGGAATPGVVTPRVAVPWNASAEEAEIIRRWQQLCAGTSPARGASVSVGERSPSRGGSRSARGELAGAKDAIDTYHNLNWLRFLRQDAAVGTGRAR